MSTDTTAVANARKVHEDAVEVLDRAGATERQMEAALTAARDTRWSATIAVQHALDALADAMRGGE